MGAANTILAEELPPNVKEVLELCEKQKFTIAEYDSALLNREMEKVFKKHNKIIASLTSRTKAQLRKLNHLKKTNPDDIFKVLGGNQYAKFIKSLFMTKHEIELDALRVSSKSDFDEELLTHLIGTSSTKELMLFAEQYHIDRKETLLDTFKIKAKKSTSLINLVSKVLRLDRDESRGVNPELAVKQAAQIHSAGAARLRGVDEDVIFDIITKNSRSQCAAIVDSYLTQFHIKFERAVNMKFKGSCAKLLLLLAMPLPHAVASVLHTLEDRFLIDKVAIISIVGKYDKDFLTQVDTAAEKLFEKNLVALVGRGLSGNLLKAVQGWMENPSPDKGYERVLEMFLEAKLLAGKDLKELIMEEEFQQRVMFLLTKQTEELAKYMKEHRISFDKDGEFQLNLMDSFSESFKNKAVKEAQHAVISKYSLKNSTKENMAEYELKQRKVRDYLKAHFAKQDPHNTGLFEEGKFWSLLKQLPLARLGFTEEEIDSMKDWTEWSVEGNVQYFEVLFELSDTVITAIENKKGGGTDVMKTIDELIDDPQGRFLTETPAERRLSNSMNYFSVVPEYFLQFLYNTFAAFDFDGNGYLNSPEIASIIEILNVESLTVEKFLPSADDSVTHKAAVEVVAKEINSWFFDRSEDHFICLVDKDSGLYFWYNTKDESSQWAGGTEGDGAFAATEDYSPIGVADNSSFAQSIRSKSSMNLLQDALTGTEASTREDGIAALSAKEEVDAGAAPKSPRAPEEGDPGNTGPADDSGKKDAERKSAKPSESNGASAKSESRGDDADAKSAIETEVGAAGDKDSGLADAKDATDAKDGQDKERGSSRAEVPTSDGSQKASEKSSKKGDSGGDGNGENEEKNDKAVSSSTSEPSSISGAGANDDAAAATPTGAETAGIEPADTVTGPPAATEAAAASESAPLKSSAAHADEAPHAPSEDDAPPALSIPTSTSTPASAPASAREPPLLSNPEQSEKETGGGTDRSSSKGASKSAQQEVEAGVSSAKAPVDESADVKQEDVDASDDQPGDCSSPVD